MNQKRRCNPMERMRRADIKREFGHFLTCRSSSLNSARNMGSPLKRDDQPFWSSTNGDELDCRSTPCDTLLDRKHLYWRESRNNRTTHTC
ncbi:hypothetical protein Tcan_10449 [Toxocara canis]|uniref:Uncharacterized protein n=1 Tax=Toxocara canis TaxID=6265 RepID=A0A0B2V0F5_TOXCA|nr:hypothetical protein Tcan_10449 [Toxocara canis]